MKLIIYQDIDSFIQATLQTLIEHEVENNLIFGIVLTLQNHPERYEENYLATVVDNDQIQVIAVCTPPHKLLLFDINNNNKHEQFTCIAENISHSFDLSGVLASNATAQAFAQVWQKLTGQNYRLGMAERIYKLEEVIFPPQIEGSMRTATLKDFDLICEWITAFQKEAVPDEPFNRLNAFVQRKIECKEIAFWETEYPVSIVAKVRPTLNGITINLVYTPPAHRNKGYATNLVAAFSQSLLEEGWKFCTLFTDLSNPTSNSIYQKVGYKPVCDFQEYYFIQ